jgi:hypothetical protein
MYQAQGDMHVGHRECTFGEEFKRVLMNAPRATPTKWDIKFDMELGYFFHNGFDSGRLNGMPWGDILNFDENLRNKCGKDYLMKWVIESKKKKKKNVVQLLLYFS